MVTRKPTDKQRAKKVERAIEGVLRWMGMLQLHPLRVCFTDELSEHPYGGQADCRVSEGYPYNWVHLTWRRGYVDAASPEDLETIAIHEALHVLLFAPLDNWLNKSLSAKDQARYMLHQERIVDLMAHYLERRRPKYGYHPSGVPHTQNTRRERMKRSVR